MKGGAFGLFSGARYGTGPSLSGAVPNAVISSVDPSSGATAGGETVTLWGTGFLSGDQVIVDGANVTETVVNSGQITFTTPAHAAGSVNVLVRRGAVDSDSVTFQYTAGGGPTLVFAVDWNTELGIGDNAVTDGGVMSVASSDIPQREVIAATGLDFPTTNVLRIRYPTTGGPYGVFKQNGWELPAVGSSVWWRIYSRQNHLYTAGAALHNVQSAFSSGGCLNNASHYYGPGSTTYQHEIHVPNSGQPTGSNHWFRVILDRNTTYRIEEQYKRISSNVYEVHARVYNSAGTLLFDDDDFLCVNPSPGHGNHTFATVGNITINDETCLRHRLIVNQGDLAGRGNDDSDNNSTFYGAFAVSLVDWCGPYVAGEGP